MGTTVLQASELFAQAHGFFCQGPDHCHWCSAPCERLWPHDEPPLIPFTRKPLNIAKRPANAYICTGCRLYRRPRVTLRYLNNDLRDGQSLQKHSWLLTGSDVRGIKYCDFVLLLPLLLKPPLTFALSLLDRPDTNHLQLVQVNQLAAIRADTPLAYNLNNVTHFYSIYELQQALEHGSAGKQPGVRALCDLLGLPESIPYQPEGKRGRPSRNDAALDTDRLVTS